MLLHSSSTEKAPSAKDHRAKTLKRRLRQRLREDVSDVVNRGNSGSSGLAFDDEVAAVVVLDADVTESRRVTSLQNVGERSSIVSLDFCGRDVDAELADDVLPGHGGLEAFAHGHVLGFAGAVADALELLAVPGDGTAAHVGDVAGSGLPVARVSSEVRISVDQDALGRLRLVVPEAEHCRSLEVAQDSLDSLPVSGSWFGQERRQFADDVRQVRPGVTKVEELAESLIVL